MSILKSVFSLVIYFICEWSLFSSLATQELVLQLYHQIIGFTGYLFEALDRFI